MYIRWKEKPRDPKWGYDENQRWRSGVRYESMLHVAYLVESKRLNGKPRQASTYLASIQERRLQSPYDRARFWQSVQKKLQPYGGTVCQDKNGPIYRENSAVLEKSHRMIMPIDRKWCFIA
jgi:hypothetical protein